MELEIQRAGGYRSAAQHSISDGETNLTQTCDKKRIWQQDKKRNTDGKTKPPTPTNKHPFQNVL